MCHEYLSITLFRVLHIDDLFADTFVDYFSSGEYFKAHGVRVIALAEGCGSGKSLSFL